MIAPPSAGEAAPERSDVRLEINPHHCVSCLACVRACPVEAIEVEGPRVQIVEDACIRCGACVPACPHDAVDVAGDLGRALELAVRGDAVLLLSVEAEVYFHPRTPVQLVNACYRAGFPIVHRGVLGDELVAAEYQRLWDDQVWGTMIRSTCPVVVETVRRSYPELLPYLALVKTPLAAEVDYLTAKHGDDVRIVYAGVCLDNGDNTLDAVITLDELAQLLRAREVDIGAQSVHFTRIPEERRRHVSMAGGLPLAMLTREPQASRRFRKIRRDLGQLDTISKAVTQEGMEVGFVDILPCEGCLDHPLLGPRDELFWRRKTLADGEPPRSPVAVLDPAVTVDVARGFDPHTNGDKPDDSRIASVIERIGTAPDGKPWDCAACGFRTCAGFAGALLKGRAAYRQCPPYQERRAKKAQEEAAVDELTGLATYRVLRDTLQHEIARSGRTGEPFGVLFADLDRFKDVNDRCGHEAGNRVLLAVADVLRDAVRSSDVAARYGGDEFVVVLNGTNADGALRVAEEIRRAVERSGLDAGHPVGLVTVSVGVAAFDPQAVADEDVLDVADRALYHAKAEGGNRVA